MKPIGGANPALMTDTHAFWFYPDRIVQVEIGGRFVQAIEYADLFQRISQSFGMAELPPLNKTENRNPRGFPRLRDK